MQYCGCLAVSTSSAGVRWFHQAVTVIRRSGGLLGSCFRGRALSAVPDLLGFHRFTSGWGALCSLRPKFSIPFGHFREWDLQCVTEVKQIFWYPEKCSAALTRCGQAKGKFPPIWNSFRMENRQYGPQFPPALECDAREVLKETYLCAIVR